ncbi:MAG: SDR family oxidoreductase [Deltaproteobacteria bacterium]|nr:SDR family oxidoreductase [Deltaproteobacteria bacterium]
MERQKTIIVTGAGAGIGRETALLFANRGWFVGIFDIDEQALRSLQSEIGKDNSCLQVVDVTDIDGVRNAVSRFAQAADNRLDVLFNNAGIARMGLNESIDIADQQRIVAVNFTGVLNCIDASLQLLKETTGARIITMSSSSTIYGIPELAVYSATKHAVSALTEALDIELRRHDIRVSDILAPYVKTGMVTRTDERSYSVKTMGVNLEPARVAETVWKAAHGNKTKTHWLVSGALVSLKILFWAFPFARRFLIRRFALSPQYRKTIPKNHPGKNHPGRTIRG